MTSATTGYDAFRSSTDHVGLHMIGAPQRHHRTGAHRSRLAVQSLHRRDWTRRRDQRGREGHGCVADPPVRERNLRGEAGCQALKT